MNGKVMLKGVPYFSDSQVMELTRAEYDALPNSKYTDGVLYCIKDEGVMKGNTFSPIIYSLAEREVGVWTDGKPLYQKTIVLPISDFSTTTDGYVLHGIDNIDFPVYAYGFPYKENLNYGQEIVPASATLSNAGINAQWSTAITYFNRTRLGYFLGSERLSRISQFYFTLQYTKTTDNPGTGQWTTSGVPAHHYSTSEQIVGTWIDGKTLYEKTIVGNTLGNSSTTTTLFMATVEMIHKYDTVLKNASGNVVNSNMLYNGSYHYRVAVDSNGTRMYLTRNDVSAWQDWYPVVTIQYTKTTD